MKKIILSVLLGLGLVSFTGCGEKAGAGFSKSVTHNNISAKFSSAKPLVVGNNKLDILLKTKGESLSGANVRFKIYMPEMPGMPYMEDSATLNEANGLYSGVVNFSMAGTWQVVILVEKDGKKYKIKSSVNL